MTEHEPTKNGKKSEDTRFQPGNPGGPGRPAGSRNGDCGVLDQLADAGGREILEKLIDAAKGGDMRAADLVLSRIWPVRKGRPNHAGAAADRDRSRHRVRAGQGCRPWPLPT